ncbi:MAG: DNA alkylation repair protein [Treponema sp.]
MVDFITELIKLKDEKYRVFTQRLIPNIPLENIIGVRTPILRSLAKKLYKQQSEECKVFLTKLPHKYLDENMLHAFLICQFKDFEKVMSLTESFLPYIDNWAVCDSFNPKVFSKNLEFLINKIKKWILSTHPYTVRYAIGLLLKYYLTDAFKEEYLKLVASIRSDEYYINMMIAWFFAESLAKQKVITLPFIEKKELTSWTHNKAIQKAIESKRISPDFKLYLKSLKVKN